MKKPLITFQKFLDGILGLSFPWPNPNPKPNNSSDNGLF